MVESMTSKDEKIRKADWVGKTLKDIPMEERKKEASKPLYLTRYD
jgi:hypothetical protein